MKKHIFFPVLFSGLLMASVVSASEVVHTLSGNPNIPDDEIRWFYGDEAWHMIESTPYQGYAIIQGRVNNRSLFCPHKVTECYPDESRNEIAMKLAGNVKLPYSTVGTRISPSADVYVVFYEENSEKRTALVFGERRKEAYVSESFMRDKYMSLFSY